MSSTLHVEDVSRRYGRRWALVHVALTLGAGESWMVLGNNGSGKSTLLRCLATALRVHEGRIRYGERDLWEHRFEVRSEIAFLAHQTHLYDDLSAIENLRVWAHLGGLDRSGAEALLDRVGLDPSRRDPVRTFSAGMRRRVALARVLLKTPKVVLLDEPFTALDPGGRALVVEIVRDLSRSGATVVMATHLFAVSRQVCDRAVLLDEGRVTYAGAADGAPRELAFE